MEEKQYKHNDTGVGIDTVFLITFVILKLTGNSDY